MGQSIEKIALNRGHLIVARLTSNDWDLDALKQADLCMEFTHPDCVLDNLRKVADLKKNIVIGTTGWQSEMDQVHSIVAESHIGLLYSPNFSVGVYLFKEILAYAANLMNAFEDYDVAGLDYHHHAKKDQPSGTALELARSIEEKMKRIDKVPFSSIRCGSAPGTHTIFFDSPCDTITLTHSARNREGFAKGAVQAAEWLKGKQGFYTFADYMEETIDKRIL